MHIGLIDVDGTKFPNLVLMKLSALHKRQGDTVQLLRPDDVLLGGDLFGDYEKLYAACVFTENADTAQRLENIGAEVGGTGTDRAVTLPHEIEHVYPDYALYGDTKTAYGFLTRGCPRACPFCIVAGKMESTIPNRRKSPDAVMLYRRHSQKPLSGRIFRKCAAKRGEKVHKEMQ